MCCGITIWATICWVLTHWGRVMHICVSKWTTTGSDNGLSPGRGQAIIWTNAGILLIRPLGTNFSEILIGVQTFSFKKMEFIMSSAKWHSFCLSLNELKAAITHKIFGANHIMLTNFDVAPGPVFTKKTPSYSIGIPIINLRWSPNGLWFIMGIPMPIISQHLLVNIGPGGKSKLVKCHLVNIRLCLMEKFKFSPEVLIHSSRLSLLLSWQLLIKPYQCLCDTRYLYEIFGGKFITIFLNTTCL